MYVQSKACGAFCGGLAGRKALPGCVTAVSGPAGFGKKSGVGEYSSLGRCQRMIMVMECGRRENVVEVGCYYQYYSCPDACG